eukprot:Sro23_g016090.1 n/a (1761) ;mRNA; r:149404-154822
MSSASIDLRQKLNHQISIIGCHENPPLVRRQAVTHLLEMIAVSPDDDTELAGREEFPTGAIRETLSSLIFHIGQGDGQLREFLLEQISSDPCPLRQLFLDFLPSCMPIITTKDDNTVERTTFQVMEYLRTVLTRDPSALIPIFGCLSSMAETMTSAGRQKAFSLSLQALEFASETDLPVLVRALLRISSNSEQDAVRALEALRTELMYMETSTTTESESENEDAITVVAHVVINALLDDANNHQIAKAYVTVLKDITLKEEDETSSTTKDNQEHDDQPEFVTLDLMVLVTIFQHQDFVNDVEQLLDQLLVDATFPFALLSKLTLLLCDKRKNGRPTSILYPRMIPSLVSFAVFLLLTPARTSSNNKHKNDNNRQAVAEQMMKQTQDWILKLHRVVDRDVQTELVHLLLQLSDKVASSNWADASKQQQARQRLQFHHPSAIPENDKDSYEWFQIIIADKVNAILHELARSSKQSFASLKHVLIGWLTSTTTCTATPQWEQYCMRRSCSILSVLCEPAGGSSGGIQASEIMILLQKLLFTSSSFYSAKNAFVVDSRRVVKGLLLARELVKTASLAQGDWDCIKQWVLKILLPTTRRMVEPEIGIPGLAFLETLMTMDSGGEEGLHEQDDHTTTTRNMEAIKETFEHMKMVLANTGLIQILAYYQQQQQQAPRANARQRDPAMLAYTTPPPDEFLTPAGKKRKNRKMAFCLAFFLRNTDVYLSSRWYHTVHWVFHLVETYLRVGRTVSISTSNGATKEKRKKSSQKWVPHGWLQAAIEFPAFVLNHRDFDPENAKQQDALEWAKTIFSCDEYSPCLANDDSAAAGLADLLLQAETSSQLKPVVKRAMLLGLSSLLAVSLSFAVVANAYGHLQNLPVDECGYDERLETLRLIQFQMMKIYDIRRKSDSVECLLRSVLLVVQKLARRFGKVSSEKSLPSGESSGGRRSRGRGETWPLTSARRSSSGGQTDGDQESDMVNRLMKQLTSSHQVFKRLRQKLFVSEAFLSPDVLFVCLADAEQSNLMKEYIEALLAPQSSCWNSVATKLLHLAHMRRCLLEHLVSLISCKSSKDLEAFRTSSGVACFSHCVDIAFHLFTALPKLRKASHTPRSIAMIDPLHAGSDAIETLSSLTRTYFQYICVMFAGLETSESVVSPSALIDACSGILVSKGVLSEKDRNDTNPKTFEGLWVGFFLQLQSCNDAALACQLLELLEILSGLSSKETAAQETLNANWKALHTVYSWSERSNTQRETLPYSLMACLRRTEAGTLPKTVSSCLHDTVLKRPGNVMDSAVRQWLLRHLGLLSLVSQNAESGTGHFLRVFKELSDLLDSLDRPLEFSESDEEKKEDGSKDWGERKAKKIKGNVRQTDSFVSGIPDLHAGSCPSAFEALLHVSVGGMAVLSLSRPIGSDVLGTKESGPYIRYKNLMVLFGGLLELYEKRAHLLPRRILPTLFAAIKHMLAMTVWQLHNLVEWRNSQPLLTPAERARGSYDQGDTRYLEHFIRACWTHTIVRPLAFCEHVKLRDLETATKARDQQQRKLESVAKQRSQSRSSKQTDDDSDYRQSEDEDDNSEGAYTKGRTVSKDGSRSRVHRKVNALRYAIEKVSQVLVSIASSHNFSTSNFVNESPESVVDSPRKRKTREDDGFHRLDGTAKGGEVSHVLGGRPDKGTKLRRRSNEEDSDSSDRGKSLKKSTVVSRNQGMAITNDDDSLGEGGASDTDDCFQVGEEDDQSTSSEQFCVSGNWGEEESQASSSSGSQGLELETPIF